MLVHAGDVQLPVRVKASGRFLCLNGYVNAFCNAKHAALRVRIAAKEVLAWLVDHGATAVSCRVVAIWTLPTNPHAKDVLAHQKDGYPEAIDAGKAVSSNDGTSVVMFRKPT